MLNAVPDMKRFDKVIDEIDVFNAWVEIKRTFQYVEAELIVLFMQ
jgi:hypothetical protein